MVHYFNKNKWIFIIFFGGIYVITTGFLWWGPKLSKHALELIDVDEARNIVSFLAADSLMGRNTPSPELDKAAEYIASKFKSYGLLPVNGSYFQEVRLHRISLGDTNQLVITDKDGTPSNLPIKKEFIPFEMTANKQVAGDVVFAGYGITAPELAYDDYANLDVNGKIVVIVKDAPRQFDSESPFYHKKDLGFNKIAEKVRNAIEHGATGLLIVTNPLNSKILRPSGFPWPSLYKNFPADAIPLTLGTTEEKKIPVVHVGEAAVKQFFGSIEKYTGIVKKIDSTLTPNSFLIVNSQAMLKTSTQTQVLYSKNVVAFCPGTDKKLKDEVIVIGGHYDHLGYKKKVTAGQDSIYNGADDNASGTAGVMLIARAFAASEIKPRRSVLFLAFTGEEKMLWGSEAYVEQPLFPIKKTVAMLNLDMIGRGNIDSLYLYGMRRSPELNDLAMKENRKADFTIVPERSNVISGSDHVNFGRKNIPVLFFHSGTHGDYHQVSDHAEKINYEKLCRISQYCLRIAWNLANSSDWPTFIKIKKTNRLAAI
ncbi:M20/M25/M40 family metallo-hydrolase [candidate division KSB1 bacterium]|nr:M20/M25/M40 family metallo-hydrolase [candidate division KSB1 bacterium]